MCVALCSLFSQAHPMMLKHNYINLLFYRLPSEVSRGRFLLLLKHCPYSRFMLLGVGLTQ